MALEPSLQLALLIMPTMIILGWLTGQFVTFKFDICESTSTTRSEYYVVPLLRAKKRWKQLHSLLPCSHFLNVYFLANLITSRGPR